MKKIVRLIFLSIALGSCVAAPPRSEGPLERLNSAETLKKPYVILVSIDGYRPDYTRRYMPPNLLRIEKKGASAEGMIPVFPSKTFPNHLSLITGRYAENHGIVANYFHDLSRAVGKTLYQISDSKAVGDGSWYQAEPLWVAAERQGMRTACYFWPGSEAEIGGVRPSFFLAYKKDAPNDQRVDAVENWLRLPVEKRPHFITLYFSDVDSAGHEHGPDSKEVREAVLSVDRQIGRLEEKIQKLGISVNLIIVSDHGMAKLDPKKVLYLDDYADFSGVLVGDMGPQLVIYAKGESPEAQSNLERLYQKLKKREEHFKVWRRSELPARFHLSGNPRAGDLIVSAELPYSVGIRDKRYHPPVATHGYDTLRYRSMNASFYAEGPGIRHRRLKPFPNVDVYPFLMELLELKIDSPIDGDLQRLKSLLLERTPGVP